MALSSGFYNSVNHDRKYDADDISRLFDGLIKDGVFASIGTCFMVKEGSGLTVNVGIGRAWFNHTWTYNDAILPVTAPQSDLLLGRIDTLVLEVNAEDATRANTIKFISGTAASKPTKPVLTNTEKVHQYPLCHITRTPNNDSIIQADIENTVGTDACPFVSGVLETITIDEILPQWRSELDRFVGEEKEMMNAVVKLFQEAAVQAGQGLQPATKDALGTVKLSDQIGINSTGQLDVKFIKRIKDIRIGSSALTATGNQYYYRYSDSAISSDSVIDIYYDKNSFETFDSIGNPTYSISDGHIDIIFDANSFTNIYIDDMIILNIPNSGGE